MLSIKKLIPSQISKFLNDNNIDLITSSDDRYMYSNRLSVDFKLSIDLPISSISNKELYSTQLYSCLLTLSQDNNFILSFKVSDSYVHYKKEDVSNSFVKTVKDQLDIIDYVFEKDIHKFTISSKN